MRNDRTVKHSRCMREAHANRCDQGVADRTFELDLVKVDESSTQDSIKPTKENENVLVESREDFRAESVQVSLVDMALMAFLAGGRLRLPVAEKRYSSKREEGNTRNNILLRERERESDSEGESESEQGSP